MSATRNFPPHVKRIIILIFFENATKGIKREARNVAVITESERKRESKREDREVGRMKEGEARATEKASLRCKL